MTDLSINEQHLTVGTASCFLPGTNIQYVNSDEEQYAKWLIRLAKINGECWECHLAPNAKGYCNVQVGGREGIKWRVHRLIWTIINGPIPSDKIILHSCDNRKCIRPEHISCGTDGENTQDMMEKGRHSNGDGSHHIDRKEFTGRRIKSLLGEGLSGYQIAKRLHISPSTVSNYINPNGVYHEYLN